jgi:hypothetical protein
MGKQVVVNVRSHNDLFDISPISIILSREGHKAIVGTVLHFCPPVLAFSRQHGESRGIVKDMLRKAKSEASINIILSF